MQNGAEGFPRRQQISGDEEGGQPLVISGGGT
jgi:hypothetical protein